MWTSETRALYDRSKLRYPSDLRDEQWALLAGLIPPGKRGGRRRRVDVREVLNGVLCVLSTGCQWRALPQDLMHPKLYLLLLALGVTLLICLPAHMVLQLVFNREATAQEGWMQRWRKKEL